MTTVHGSSENARLGAVEYRVLGPVSAFLEAKPRQLGGKRQRMVLAILLSRPNQFVSQDSLIDAVWAGEPPDAAKQTLHAYVSTLRKQLDGGIEREGDGYIVRVENGQLDSLRFQELVDRGRGVIESSPLEASSLLREGLALWQGPAFGDLNGEPALVSEVVRLEEARLTAIEYRVDADLRSGNHQTVVQELEALTREHPFRERLEGFLMLALYRSGRQADALRSYRRAQLFLADELGIDPSPGLQVLEEQILQQSPELDWSEQTHIAPMARGSARGYELREKVDENRYGVFYRGFQGSVGREVMVLSLMEEFSSDPEFVRRFESELGAVSQLEHPHLLPIYDFWRDPDGAFLVTTYLRGESLRDSISHEPWNLSSVLPLMDHVSSALGFAHRNGFTHGLLDIDSIGLDDDGNAYIIDLGLSSLVRTQGDRSALPDVEGLARIVFSSLTGVHNPRGGRISEVRSDLAVLDPVFQRAFNPDPASRYQKVEDFRRAFRQAAGADIVPPSEGISGDQRRNPYKGLRAFQESDATDFHGRDALVEDLIEILASGRILAVVGPSGSGKSSLVRAGLLSALRNNAIEGSGSWLITEMFPGTHPFEELEAAILRVAVDRPSGLTDDLTADPRGLIRIAKEVLPTEGDELVLVVDQLEELFSLTSSEADRKLFIDTLIAAVSDERSRIRVILTLRADFFDQPLRYSNFGEVLGMGLVPVGPPTDDGLARAVAQPARAVGVDLEPGLVTRIVDDVRDEPGGLPLMQHVLTELFIQREHNTLTLAAYEQSGGVLGSLGKRAEEIYEGLTADGKQAARQLFLRLVMVDELADDTRRRVRQTELKNLEIRQETLDGVIARFGSFRLLSFDRDAATRTPTVEVAHEALIREWERFRTWIDERREDLLIHRRIRVTVRDWEDSGKDQSYLLRGSRLEQALIWQERTDIAISADEMTFIEASIEQEKRDQAEHQALEDKAARRRKAVISSLAGGLVVAGILGVVALDRAQEARVTAAVATSRELATSAMDAIEEDPELAVLLALEAIGATDELGLDPVPEAISAVRNTQAQMRMEFTIAGGFQAITYSPNGGTILSDEPGPQQTGALVWDAKSGQPMGRLDDPDETKGRPSFIAFSPSGDIIAVARDYYTTRASDEFTAGASDEHLVAGVDLYDSASLRHAHSLMGDWLFYSRPSFSRSGFVASVGGDEDGGQRAYVWDSTTGEEVRTYDSETSMNWAEFLPGTDILVLVHGKGINDSGDEIAARVRAVKIDTEIQLWEFDIPGLDPAPVSISPDGSMVALTDWVDHREVQVRRLPDGEMLLQSPHQSPQQVVWNADSSRIAVSGNDGDVTIFDVDTQAVFLTLSGHQASVWGLGFSPDEEHLASASLDGNARVWNITTAGSGGDRAIDLGGIPAVFWMKQDEDLLFVSMENANAEMVDLQTGESRVSYPTPYSRIGSVSVVNESFTTVGGRRFDDRGVLFDAATGEEIAEFPDCQIPGAVSSDGTLVVLDSQLLPSCEAAEPSGVLDLDTGEMVIDLGHRDIAYGLFSPGADARSGYLVLNVDGSSLIEVYSLVDRRLIGSLGKEEIEGFFFLLASFDTTGRYLGLGTNGPLVVAVDIEAVIAGAPMADAIVLKREAHKGNSPFVAVTSGGVAISAGFDGLYRAWDIESSSLIWEIRVDGLTTPPSARISSDETELAYEDAGGVIRFTPLDSNLVIERARASMTRGLTDDECQQYLHTDGCLD